MLINRCNEGRCSLCFDPKIRQLLDLLLNRSFSIPGTIPAFPIFLGKEAMVTLRREDGYPRKAKVHLENYQYFLTGYNTNGYPCAYTSLHLTTAELTCGHILLWPNCLPEILYQFILYLLQDWMTIIFAK